MNGLLDELEQEVVRAASERPPPPAAPPPAKVQAKPKSRPPAKAKKAPAKKAKKGPAKKARKRPPTKPPPPPAAARKGDAPRTKKGTLPPSGMTAPAGQAPPPAGPPSATAATAVDVDIEVPVEAFVADAQRLITACETELGKNPSASRAARLHFEIARLYEYPLQDLRRAAAHYQEALNRAPEHVPTIRGARRVLIARKGYQTAAPLFDAEARLTSDPHRKAALFYQKGRLLEDVMGARDEAKTAYQTALELDRGDPALLKAVEQTEMAAEAWGALSRTYERQANAVSQDPRQRAALVVQRARLLERRRGEIDAAIELYETALRLDPDAPGALAALKRLHHSLRRWRDLIRVLELEAGHTKDAAVRVMALYQIGRLHTERLGNRSEALAALERAIAEAPTEPLVLTELSRLYEVAERWDALVSVLERLTDATPAPEERLGFLARIGELHEERLGDEERAQHFYGAALRVEPTYVPALQALGKLYRKRGQWDALVAMHLAEADATDDAPRRASAYARVGEILEQHLDRPSDAIDAHKKALSQVPGYPTAFKALTRLLSDAGHWRELVEVYERAVDQAKTKERAIIHLMKIGAVYEDQLKEPVQAAHAYRRVLERDADHVAAIHALQRATERAGRYAELVEALELEAEKTQDQDEIVALVHRAGEVLDEQLGDRDGALSRFRKVLGVNPRYAPALVSLGRIYFRAGRWEDLLEMYKRELELTPRGPGAVALLHKMGELCEERVGRDEEAVGYYRRALDIDARHAPTLRSLSAKLRERGDWEDLVRVLELELSGATDASTKARIGYQIGEVYEERLGQTDRAIHAYETALKAVPEHRPAIDALSRLRVERKAWTKLVQDLDREAGGTTDLAVFVSALLREGEIWAEELGEPRRAIACYERVLERDPGNVGALMALEPLYRRIGGWESLGHVYDALARVLTDPGARIAALRELARLQEHRGSATGGDPRHTYDAILQAQPDDTIALAALEAIALERGDRRLLADVDRRLAESRDKAIRSVYLTRLAESLEAAGRPEAIDAYRAALEADPENLGATRGLSRIAENTGDPVALAEAARREANVATDGEIAAQLLVKSARVRAHRLDDSGGALKDLERALELSPDSVDAADDLSEMLVRERKPGRLADLLSRAAGSAAKPDRVAALWNRVAEIQADALDNLPGAISSLNRVLRAAPNHVPTLRSLSELYNRDGQWTEAVNLLSRVVQLAPDRETLKDAHLALAALWDERLGESSRALVSLQAVLALDADNRHALSRLSSLQEKEGKVDQAAETAAKLVQASRTDAERAQALLHLASVEGKRGDARAELDALLSAVALEGPASESALTLKSLLSTPTEWEAYDRAMQRFLTAARERGDDLGAVYLELARVRQDQLQKAQGAVDILLEGIDAVRDPAALRNELAMRLRMAGRNREAVEQLRTLLYSDLLRPEAWRDLARNFDALGRQGESRLALMPLAILGAASDAEIGHLATHGARPAVAHEGSLTNDVLKALLPKGPTEEAAGDLLASLGPGLPKLYPPDLEAFGLVARDRVTSRQGHPLRVLADRIASILGVEDFELYVHRVRSRGLAVELSNPPSLLVPAQVAELPETQQVFLLTRPLAAISAGLHPVEKLTPREVEVLLASACRNVSPGYGSGLTSEDFLADQAKRIHKALPRRVRKSVEGMAGRYVETPRLDFPRWSAAVGRVCQAVAALLSDDLVACVEVMQRSERELSGLEGPALVRSSSTVRDLLRFWVSDAGVKLRQQIGMLD